MQQRPRGLQIRIQKQNKNAKVKIRQKLPVRCASAQKLFYLILIKR